MIYSRLFIVVILLGIVLLGCSPKVVEEVVNVEERMTPPPNDTIEEPSPCPGFSEAPNPDEASTNYVLYRDFLRAKEYEQAFDYWKKVYEVAPAADGQRNTVYADGIRFYERFMREERDSVARDAYIDKIFALYDEIDVCYKEGGYVLGRKAFDLYYKYPHRATRREVYDLFKASIEEDGLETNDFVINPFTALLVELYFSDQIDLAEAKKYEVKIREIIAHGMKECEGVGCDRWKIILEYAPVRLEAFETVRDFYDCEYYMAKYYPEFEAAQSDCDVIRTVYSRLKWGNCEEVDERFRALIQSGNENCVETGPLELAYEALRNAKYQEAIELFAKAASEEEDPVKKSRAILIIAKIYNAHLKNFPQARKYALQAADINPNWGEPYILIGRLYASSGPLCGPGRGWDSQVVVWPAIDMWAKAKSVDPSVAAEANKWISQYRQYMPKKEDVFIRNLKAGQSYRIGCWIQTTTIIRTAD